MNGAELGANALNTISILLAGRNSAHTWWTGIAGCALFCWVFYDARLYADTALQVFFVASSALGWWAWLHGRKGDVLPVSHCPPAMAAGLAALGSLVAAGYGWMLHRYTNAYSPFWDSVVLAFSVLGQFLLMARRVESWWCWLLVNTISVPLFASRGLWITAILYAGYWINAIVSLRTWQKLAAEK